MIPVYKVTFFSKSDFYGVICDKLYDMRLLFNADHTGLLSDGWYFSVNEMTTEQKKVLCNFLRNIFNDKDFHFTSSFHVGYIDKEGV